MTTEEEFLEYARRVQDKHGLCPTCSIMYELGRHDERTTKEGLPPLEENDEKN